MIVELIYTWKNSKII